MTPVSWAVRAPGSLAVRNTGFQAAAQMDHDVHSKPLAGLRRSSHTGGTQAEALCSGFLSLINMSHNICANEILVTTAKFSSHKICAH